MRKENADPRISSDNIIQDAEDLRDEEVDVTSSDVRISTFPSPRRPTPPGDDTRYLGVLSHSGFHNQRMELQNALLLGKLLNRTV